VSDSFRECIIDELVKYPVHRAIFCPRPPAVRPLGRVNDDQGIREPRRHHSLAGRVGNTRAGHGSSASPPKDGRLSARSRSDPARAPVRNFVIADIGAHGRTPGQQASASLTAGDLCPVTGGILDSRTAIVGFGPDDPTDIKFVVSPAGWEKVSDFVTARPLPGR
jgi:hypothetical protein